MPDPFVDQAPLRRRHRGSSWIWGLLLVIIAIGVAGWYWNDVYRVRDTSATVSPAGTISNPPR
jgi:hypothetical protein